MVKTIFRARARWAMEGEKPSAYFLGLERRKTKDMTITALKDENGRILTSNQEILERQKSYFTKIYEESPDPLYPIADFDLSRDDVPNISDLDKVRLERPFTPEELFSALKSLNKGKSPGSDGITPEFYLQFWDSLCDPFMDSILFSLDNGILSEGQRTGLIKLIPKKDLDRQEIANWRPITLLNVDFKILSKAISARIQSCITQIIAPDQTGFIRGRYIGTNLINVRSLIDHVDASDSSGLLLAVDYQKAFDTVRWELIFTALDLFGFGNYIVSAIKTMFKGIKTAVCNAGYSSSFFSPSRGVRQGCCASPSLFTITVELLAILVRNSVAVKGILVDQSEFKISQYADDSTFFVRDFHALQSLLDLLNRFTKFSGLAINPRKSHLLLLGNHRHHPTEFNGIKVVQQVKILGIIFRRRMTDSEQYNLNFQPHLQRIKQICKAWANRDMSLKGKVTLIKSLIISLLQYPCSCTITPPRVFPEFKKIMVDFLWSGKRSKIAYALLIQDIDHGGLNLPDLLDRVSTSLISWIRNLWRHQDSPWAQVLKHHLHLTNVREVTLCKTNLSTTGLLDQLPLLKQIMNNWAEYHIYEPWTEQGVKQEYLWHNDFITVGGKTLNWQDWKDSGILSINDLWHATQPRFLSDFEIRNKFRVKCSFLQLLQLRSALPSHWKRLLQNVAPEQLTYKPLAKKGQQTEVDIERASSSKIYKALVSLRLPTVSSQVKWNTLFPLQEMHEDSLQQHWRWIYRLPYRTARDTKLQAFQFRLLHRIIPCNKYLKNIRIRQDDQCPNCDEQDSLQHFFFNCPKVHDFWTKLAHWLHQNTPLNLQPSLKNILFGFPVELPADRAINFIILFTKFFIYRQRLFHQTELDLLHLLMELRIRLRLERYICDLEGKPNKMNIWKHLLTAMG